MLRRASVAGQFYPSGAEELDRTVRGLITGQVREKALALIAPHAGYVYSGGVAGAVYSRVEVPDDVILIGPNHTGLGRRVSVMESGAWEMPFGRVEINEELAGLVIASHPGFEADEAAHLREHSLEVQLPFIHRMNPAARIVPITVMHAAARRCVELGEALAGVVSGYPSEVLIAVSSDMNHYESDEATRKKDRMAIEKVLALDPAGLLEVTGEHDITMCGVLPSAIAIAAAKRLGAKEAELVRYATSAEASGDYSHVVGYAGILIR